MLMGGGEKKEVPFNPNFIGGKKQKKERDRRSEEQEGDVNY